MRRAFVLLLACNLAAWSQAALKGNASLTGAATVKAVAASAPTPAPVAHTFASASGGGTATTPDIDCSAAIWAGVGVGNYSASAAAITLNDSQGNTYTPATDRVGPAGDIWHVTWFVKSAPSVSASMHWTATAGSYVSIMPVCFSNTTGGIDQDAGGGSDDGNAFLDAGSITPSATGYLGLTAISWQGGTVSSIDNSYTIIDNQPQTSNGVGLAIAYKVLGSGASNPRWTLSTGGNRTADHISVAHN